MGHIINPNTQTLNDGPLNIRMEGDPGQTPTIIPSKNVYINYEQIQPNKYTVPWTKSKHSAENAISSISISKPDDNEALIPGQINTYFIWNPNQNVRGQVKPKTFQVGYGDIKCGISGKSSAIPILEDVYDTWQPSSQPARLRAFDEIYIAGEVLTEEDDAILNQDADGNPIYLSGVLGDDGSDGERDQEVKDYFGIEDDMGIIFQEEDNNPEPWLHLKIESNDSWIHIYSNSYMWDGNWFSPGELPTSYGVVTHNMLYNVSANSVSAFEGTVSGRLDSQLVSSSIGCDGGTATVRFGNTKSGSNVTGFTFTDADNSQAVSSPRTGTITYSYYTMDSDPEFKGSGTITVTQEGGDATMPNPTITYSFSDESNCSLSQLSQGPQDKSGAVGSVIVTANANSATKGSILFSDSSKMTVTSGSTVIASATSTSGGSGSIGVNGGTYSLNFSEISGVMPKNTNDRTISFKTTIDTEYDANNGDGIENNGMTWAITQKGYTYDSPYLKITYTLNGIEGYIDRTFSSTSKNVTLNAPFAISPNTGKYNGATTNPVIKVDTSSGTIMVPDNGGTICVDLSNNGTGTWLPGYTVATSPITYTIVFKSAASNAASSINTNSSAVGKTIVLTQAGASKGSDSYKPVVISATKPSYALNNPASVTLNNPSSTGAIQYQFDKMTQPTVTRFDMDLVDEDYYTCGNITVQYSNPIGYFDKDISMLSISDGSLTKTELTFRRLITYQEVGLVFTSSNPEFVNYKGLDTWDEDGFGGHPDYTLETNAWTVKDSVKNKYYRTPSIYSGSGSTGNGASTFGGAIAFNSVKSGSEANISATITAKLKDNESITNSVTITRAAVGDYGLKYDISCSNNAWSITKQTSSIGESGTIEFSGTINASSNIYSECTITVTIYSVFDANVKATKSITISRNGVYTTTADEYQWVANGNNYEQYTINNATLSCSVDVNDIDYWTSQTTFTGSGNISSTSNNVTITTCQPQKQQSRTVTTTHIVTSTGETTSVSYSSWVDNGQTQTAVITTTTNTGITKLQHSSDNNTWNDGNTVTVTISNYGSSGTTLGTPVIHYFRNILVYNGNIVATSASVSASAARYGISYYNE